MSQNKENEKNINSDLEESNKNEEDLLAFSSKYKTNIYKEEDIKENDIDLRNVRNRLSLDSTSISQEHSNISGYNLKNINTLPKEEDIRRSIEYSNSSKNYFDFQEKHRKMSSPICCYYDGSDIYLSKTQKTTIDIDKSPNFVRKDSFFNNSDKINNNNSNFNNDINNNNLNINLLYQNNNNFSSKTKFKNEFKKIDKNNEIKRLSLNSNQLPYNNMNNFNIIQGNNIINNNFYFQNNNYPQQIFNINYINLNNFQNNPINPINNKINKRKLTYNIEDGFIGNYFNNILNLNNNTNTNEHIFNVPQPQAKLSPILFSYNEEQEKFTKYDINRKSSNKSIPNNPKNEKKPFDKRKGDWLCPECHNLNFAFRIVCNRCQLPKPNNSSNGNGQ